MKLDVITLDGGKAGSVDLTDDIYGLEPRADILHRVVRWQRAKAQAGTHSVLTRTEVSYSTKKIYKQKGTGGARHGSRKAPIFRKGGIYKGPTPRSHGHELTKKFFQKLGKRTRGVEELKSPIWTNQRAIQFLDVIGNSSKLIIVKVFQTCKNLKDVGEQAAQSNARGNG